MKIYVIKNYDHRLAPARTQAFRAGQQVSVPKKTAEQLIAAGAAKPVTAEKE